MACRTGSINPNEQKKKKGMLISQHASKSIFGKLTSS